MSKYRCSRCKKTYNHRQYRNLPKTSRVTDDPNDKYGVETVCECGERFHSNKWGIRNEIEKDGEEIGVSTVALTIPHGLNRNDWYETCLFYPGGNRVVRRYSTESSAEEGHMDIMKKIENGEYHYYDTSYGKAIELE